MCLISRKQLLLEHQTLGLNLALPRLNPCLKVHLGTPEPLGLESMSAVFWGLESSDIPAAQPPAPELLSSKALSHAALPQRWNVLLRVLALYPLSFHVQPPRD